MTHSVNYVNQSLILIISHLINYYYAAYCCDVDIGYNARNTLLLQYSNVDILRCYSIIVKWLAFETVDDRLGKEYWFWRILKGLFVTDVNECYTGYA